MPGYQRKRNNGEPKLSDIAHWGGLFKVECIWCRPHRYYHPDDLRLLFGNIEAWRAGHKMRCDRCGRPNELRASPIYPTAQERQAIKVRRLVKLRLLQVPIWRDE